MPVTVEKRMCINWSTIGPLLSQMFYWIALLVKPLASYCMVWQHTSFSLHWLKSFFSARCVVTPLIHVTIDPGSQSNQTTGLTTLPLQFCFDASRCDRKGGTMANMFFSVSHIWTPSCAWSAAVPQVPDVLCWRFFLSGQAGCDVSLPDWLLSQKYWDTPPHSRH